MQAILSGLGVAAARLGTFLVQFVGFLLILAIGWIVARAVQGAIAGILHRVHFDDMVERGGVKKALQRTGWDVSWILGRIAFWTVMLFTLQFAFGVFGPNPISGVLTAIIAYLPRVFAAALIVVIGAAVAVLVREAVDAAIGGVSYGKALAGIAGGAVLFVATFMALDELAIASAIVTGLFYGSIAAIAGTVIVAVGGGGIPVMTDWWRRASTRVETAAPEIKMQAQGASERVKERANERQEQAKEMTQGSRDRETAGSRSGGGTTIGGAGTVPPPERGRRR